MDVVNEMVRDMHFFLGLFFVGACAFAIWQELVQIRELLQRMQE